MVHELPADHQDDYDDFMAGDPSTPFTWSDGTPGFTSPTALNRLQAHYAGRLKPPPSRVLPTTHANFAASKLATVSKLESDDTVASADPPQHVRDYHYHSYLAGAAANYDPSTDDREYGYHDKFGTWHAMSPPTHSYGRR
jgi:hypothetical protein